MSKHWYKPSAKDLECNNHPAHPKHLVELFSEYTGMSEGNSKHFLDRLRHLRTCCRESENLLLFRVQPGTNQQPQIADHYVGPIVEGEFSSES